MFSLSVFFLTLMALDAVLLVHAGIYVINPRQGSTCHGGEPCTVDWLDDGQNPLLTAIGVATVGLYTGKQRLVQTIEPVDVSKVHSLTFTPIPEAGPNSDAYYISFISTSFKQNNSLPYAAFSPFFRLDKMTGSFATPDPSATSSIPVPSSVATGGRSTKTDVLSTITVGTLSTSTTSTPASTTASFPPTSSSGSASTSLRSTTTIISSTPSSTVASATSTPTSPISTSGTTSAPAMSSGFLTSVLLSTPVSSLSLPSSVSTSSALASPSASSLSSPPNTSTSGAVRSSVNRGSGVGLALTVVGLVLTL